MSAIVQDIVALVAPTRLTEIEVGVEGGVATEVRAGPGRGTRALVPIALADAMAK